MLNTNIHLINKTPYSAIKNEALKVIKNYQDDFLKHDRKILQKRDCKECILIVHKNGSYLLTIERLEQALKVYQDDFYGSTGYLFGSVKNSELVYKCHEAQIITIEHVKQEHKNAKLFFYNQTAWKEINHETALNTVNGFYSRVSQQQKAA